MKKILLVLLVIVFTFCSCFSLNYILNKSEFSSNEYVDSKYTIVLDAGHGGIDAGTIAKDNTLEKDLNFAIVKDLKEFLYICGISVVLTRDKDDLVYEPNEDRSRSDLYNRMEKINSVQNATLVSIHQNHFTDESEWGMQVFYSANNNESQVLADSIQHITTGFLQPKNTRLTKKSDSSLYLLYKAKVPSVLVECGFMSNTEENSKLKNDTYQKELAYCIALGIIKYTGEC